MELLNNFSTREKNLWSELLVDIVAALYYYPKMLRLMQAGEDGLTGAAMTSLITGTVMVAIFTGIIVSVFLHTHKTPEQVDERDLQFKARGNTIAYFVLLACIVLVMGLVVIQEMMPTFARTMPLFELTPIILANLLLVSLFISSVAKSGILLYSYRRGY